MTSSRIVVLKLHFNSILSSSSSSSSLNSRLRPEDDEEVDVTELSRYANFTAFIIDIEMLNINKLMAMRERLAQELEGEIPAAGETRRVKGCIPPPGDEYWLRLRAVELYIVLRNRTTVENLYLLDTGFRILRRCITDFTDVVI